jgi:mono/diheme cytochrome c family protein
MLHPTGVGKIALWLACAASLGWSAEGAGDIPNESKIWSGVFSAPQAARGKSSFEKSCSNCHNSDLNGSVRAPSLHGDRFLQNWLNGSVDALFVKLRDSMPANYPETVSEETKIDILSYLLQANGFPAGPAELKLDQNELADIQIVPKGGGGVANFALVRMVGCLTGGSGKAWTLSKASEPEVTKEEKPASATLRSAGDIPLGTQTFELLSVAAFQPDLRRGQKVEARGLLYREASRNLLNLSSLESAGSSCAK